MKPDILFAALAAALGSNAQPIKRTVRLVANPQHTRNLFGPLSEIAGKELELMERNRDGDCLCLFDGKIGKNVVDVDHRDIECAARSTPPADAGEKP